MFALIQISIAVAAELNVPGSHATITGAIAAAQPGDRIVLAELRFDEDIVLDGVDDLELVGAGPGTRLRGRKGPSVIRIRNSHQITLRDLRIEGASRRRGIEILGADVGEILIEGVTIVDGDAALGGGVWIAAGEGVILRRVEITGATAITGGGILVGPDAEVLVQQSVLSGNQARDGGGIHVEGQLSVDHTTFSDNAAALGAGVDCLGARCTVWDSAFQDNTAGRGAGVYVERGSAELVRNTFCRGSASHGEADAAGVMLEDTTADLRNNVFLFGEVSSQAGGVYLLGAGASVTNNTFVGNVSGMNAGAIYVRGGSSRLELTNTLIALNRSAPGSGALHTVQGGHAAGGYNLYWSNVSDDSTEGPMVGDLAVDPLLTRLVQGDCSATDLHLRVGSPALAAGDPTIQNPDGGRSDIGAFGGPDALADLDGDGSYSDEDCDDSDPEIHPGAAEACEGIDKNCDGIVDLSSCEPEESELIRGSVGPRPAGCGCGGG
ncbi:MAG TPA: hypothetical protein ENK18_24315, partial [Deltaproteobacteria bacterium]|nr:hypothetical protein [Deltaproteobacteria bacterium]